MARRSQNRLAAALALSAALSIPLSAHRRDEYLQAARVSLRTDAVGIELDLTPGIDVAAAIVGAIDRDGDGTLSDAEQQRYAESVIRTLEVTVDQQPLNLRLASSTFPGPDAMRRGEGTIRLLASATHTALGTGAHRLYLKNAHLPDRSVYLANALVPENAALTVLQQRRDPRQTELTIDYTVRGRVTVANAGWLLAGLPVAALLLRRLKPRYSPRS